MEAHGSLAFTAMKSDTKAPPFLAPHHIELIWTVLFLACFELFLSHERLCHWVLIADYFVIFKNWYELTASVADGTVLSIVQLL